MALTTDGKRLTEAHRLEQIKIAAQAAGLSRALWGQLDPSSLDGSTPRWMAAQVAVVEAAYRESVSLAGDYITSYRRAEIGGVAGPLVLPDFPVAEAADVARISGPLRVKALVGKGASGRDAHASAFNKFSGMMRRQVLMGGRMAIDGTTAGDQQAIGWRRVTDGDPCTFCAMLATRGPVYQANTAQGNVMRPLRTGGEGLRYHGHCGCTAEIVYGAWQPSEQEQGYIRDYKKAAKQADAAGEPRTQDTVLWRMRKNGKYRDSPAIRNSPDTDR